MIKSSKEAHPVQLGKAGETKTYQHYFLGVWLLYLVAACLLSVLVRFGVMDEDFHFMACLPFAEFGVTKKTLYEHVPPTGVASHIWFAFWMWLIPGISYVGLRLATCFTILLIGVAAYTRFDTLSSDTQRKVMAASWFMLVSPYFFLSLSTVMTEGPALMLTFAGLLLLWVSGLKQLLPLFLGCILLGVATIARFYFIPLLPALGVVFLFADWQRYKDVGITGFTVRNVLPYLFIIIALLPLAGLALLWGGLTPPMFNHWSELRTGISLNPTRPISTLIISGVYLAPFILVNQTWEPKAVWRTLRITLPIALILAILRVNFFQTSASFDVVFSGPIEHSLAFFLAQGEWVFVLGLYVFYTVSIYSLLAVAEKIVTFIRRTGGADVGMIYSVGFVVLFILSQAFVGGNHPFYERYLIHAWPFMGYVLAGLYPNFLNTRTYLLFAAYTLASVLILTKWGFA